jgi:hypothetical protein
VRRKVSHRAKAQAPNIGNVPTSSLPSRKGKPMLRTVGRRYQSPNLRPFSLYLPEGDLRHIDMLCNVMNVSRSELIRMLLANIRATTTERTSE